MIVEVEKQEKGTAWKGMFVGDMFWANGYLCMRVYVEDGSSLAVNLATKRGWKPKDAAKYVLESRSLKIVLADEEKAGE